MLKIKKIMSLFFAFALLTSLIPAAFANDAVVLTKENTFEANDLAPFASQDAFAKSLKTGVMGKGAADSSLFVRKGQGSSRVRISMNEKIPTTSDNSNYQWTYLTYSFNYLIEGNDNVKTWLSDRGTTALSTEIGADKMKAGQWNHVDYVVGFHKRAQNSVNSNYEIFTYLNGELLGTTGGNIFVNGNTYFDCSTNDSLKIQFVDTALNAFNLYIDDIKLVAYSDEYNGRTTADSVVRTPAPVIDKTLANVKNGTVYPYGDLNVTDIAGDGIRIYNNSTFSAEITEGNVSVGNVIVAEKDGVLAYYYVTDIPNNYEVILSENFNNSTLGKLTHPFGGDNKYNFVSGLAGKKSSDYAVNLIKGRTNCAVDCLQFEFNPTANSYLSINLTFMPTESEEFDELRLNTGSGNNFGAPIKYNAFHMNKWNKVQYVIYFDADCNYITKSYVNEKIYEEGKTLRQKSLLNGKIRIGVAGKYIDNATTNVCKTTYIDDINVTEYVGNEPAVGVMPLLKAVDGTKTSGEGSVRQFIIDDKINVSSLSGTNGEAVRAYLYDEQTKILGDEISVIDASKAQIVVVEGENGAITYYYVLPSFLLNASLEDEEGPVKLGDDLFWCKYKYTVNISNNSDNDKHIYMAMGRYNKDGILKDIAFDKGIVSKNTSNFEKTIFIDLTNADDLKPDDYIKVFAWDADFSPYMTAIRTK